MPRPLSPPPRRFHVDDISSAHVYIRLPPECPDLASIPKEILNDCAQLVKANSIEGSKKSSVRVVFTMWSNLRKDSSMATGQIGFKSTSSSALRYVNVDKKNNEIVNRITKTRKELPTSSIKEARDEFERKQRAATKKAKKATIAAEAQAKDERKKKEEMESFADIFANGKSMSNKGLDVNAEEYETDFM